jgi:hypothetical protein
MRTYLGNHVVATVNFGRGGNGTDYEAYGWHYPEDGFTWAKGGQSCLNFPKYDAPFGMYVEFNVAPLVSRGRQRITVSANGIIVGEFATTKGSFAAFYIPPLDFTATRLIIMIDQTGCPAEASVPVFCLAFFRVRVVVLDEPMPRSLNRYSLVPVVDSAAVEEIVPMPLTHFVSKFESLGTSCEVGFVQRRCGAEPLGLLRFAAIPLPQLVDAIDSDFTGLDHPDNLKPEGEIGWDIRDATYKIFYHTARRCEAVSADSLRLNEARRLRFLIRKFMGHLAQPEKIFVWWQYNPITESEIIPLFLALRRRGRVTMLWVDKDESAGLVEEIFPGLLRGRIAAFLQDGGQPDPQKSDLAWLEIMVNSLLLVNDAVIPLDT